MQRASRSSLTLGHCVMSTSTVLTLWDESVTALTSGDHAGALAKLREIQQRPDKPFFGFWFNIGKVYLDLGSSQDALQSLNELLSRDEHMAIGYYLRGCIHYKLSRLTEAMSDFETCHNKLRGKSLIDYSQLGLRYKLHACEPLYNSGILCLMLGDFTAGMDRLLQALKCVSASPRHSVIQQTIDRVSHSGINNFNAAAILELPADTVFRPPRDKIANKHQMNYLGQAKVISSSDRSDLSIGFMGPKRLEVARQKGEALSAPNSPVSPRRRKASAPALFSTKNTLVPGESTLSTSDTDVRYNNNTATPTRNIPPPPNKALPTPPPRQAPQIKVSSSSDENLTLVTRMQSGADVKVPLPVIVPPLYGLPVKPSDLKVTKKVGSNSEERWRPVVPPKHSVPSVDALGGFTQKPLPRASNTSSSSGYVSDEAPPVPPKSPLLNRSPYSSGGPSPVFFGSSDSGEEAPQLPPRASNNPSTTNTDILRKKKRQPKAATTAPPNKPVPALPVS